MSLESRLRDHLTATAEQTSITAAGPESIAAAARRRTLRTRVVTATAAVVGLAGFAASAALVDGGRGEDEPFAAPPEAAETERVEGLEESAVAEAAEAAEGAAADAASNEGFDIRAPMVQKLVTQPSGLYALGDIDGSGIPSLWTSPDGINWSLSPAPLPEDGATLSDVATTDGTAYVAGVDIQGNPLVASTTGDGTWTRAELPAVPFDTPAHSVWTLTVQQIVAGPVGVVVSGSAFLQLDLTSLLPAGAVSGQVGGEALDAVDFFDVDGNLVLTQSAAELGVDPALLQRVVNDPFAPVTLWSADGVVFLAEGVVEHETDSISLQAAPSGFVRLGADPSTVAPIVTFSVDGQLWQPGSLPTEEGDSAFSLLGNGETLIIAGQRVAQPVVWRSTDGGATWDLTELTSSFPQADEAGRSWLVDRASGGDGGFAIVVISSDPLPAESDDGSAPGAQFYLVTSVDGLSWTVTPAADIDPGFGDGSSFANAVVVTGGQVIMALSRAVDPTSASTELQWLVYPLPT